MIAFFFLKFPGKKLESSSVVLVFYHTSYIICQTSTATSTLESSSVTTKKTSRVLCPRNCPYPPPPPSPTSCGESLEKMSQESNNAESLTSISIRTPLPGGGGRGARVWIRFQNNTVSVKTSKLKKGVVENYVS